MKRSTTSFTITIILLMSVDCVEMIKKEPCFIFKNISLSLLVNLLS